MNTIMDFLKFACSGFWIFIGVSSISYLFLYFGINGIINLTKVFVRLFIISFRGWPPSHIDADGDLNKNANTGKAS